MAVFREALAADFDEMRAIERRVGQAFCEIGMTDIAGDEPPSVEALESYRQGGHAWVAVDGDDRPIAYLLSAIVDDVLYVDQVSVAPTSARQGLGAALIDFVTCQAPGEVASVTLSTFRDVPWNAGYYERIGFVEVDLGGLGVALKARIDRENRMIPGTAPRVTMQRVRRPCGAL